MNYKLLVADDEYWVREKLKHILDWPRYDIEFLEPACDGEEVLARPEQERPDILITDINMPGLSGVDLLEQLAREHEDIVMLVISGYDTFDYVKRSMRSGAINYLLKPVNKVELISAVSEALQLLHRRKAISQEQERQRLQLLRASSLMQDREFSLLLDKQHIDTMPALSMNVPLNVAGYRVVLLKIHDMTHAMEVYRHDINSLSYTVKARLRGLLDAENLLIFNHFSRSNEFILLADRREHCSRERALEYVTLLEEIFRSPVTVVLSGQSYAMTSIRVGYLEAESRLWRRSFAHRSEIVGPEAEQLPEDGELQWTREMTSQLAAFVSSRNRDMVERLLLEKTGLRGCRRRQVSCGAVMRLVNCINHDLQRFQSPNSPAEDEIAIGNLSEEVCRCVETLDREKLFEQERELIDAVLACCPAEETDTMRSVVRRVREDIDAHYYEQMTLSSLAKKYIVESSYLSRSFKQETGENLMMYLTRRRMEKAIEHIRENKVGLTEISFLVGYDDYTYFSRVFRKIMGISPREYKNRYLAEKEAGKE